MMTNFRVPRRPFGSRAGQAMLETALCFVLFITIFIAIMEFGMGIFTYNFVSYAAREGSRYCLNERFPMYQPLHGCNFRYRPNHDPQAGCSA